MTGHLGQRWHTKLAELPETGMGLRHADKLRRTLKKLYGMFEE